MISRWKTSSLAASLGASLAAGAGWVRTTVNKAGCGGFVSRGMHTPISGDTRAYALSAQLRCLASGVGNRFDLSPSRGRNSGGVEKTVVSDKTPDDIFKL